MHSNVCIFPVSCLRNLLILSGPCYWAQKKDGMHFLLLFYAISWVVQYLCDYLSSGGWSVILGISFLVLCLISFLLLSFLYFLSVFPSCKLSHMLGRWTLQKLFRKQLSTIPSHTIIFDPYLCPVRKVLLSAL
jgi:hypothetical protein